MLVWSRALKLGLINFWRNGWLSFIATLIMTLTLLIISVFLIFNLVIDETTKSIEEKMDLSVYFNDEAKDEEIYLLEKQLKSRPDVKSVEYISKDEALAKWRALNISQKVKEQVSEEENPLPRSLEIKAVSPEKIETIANYLSSEKFKTIIRRVSYQQNKDIIQKLIKITAFSQKVGLFLSIIFMTISILVILNTVKLAIHIRGPEIEVMRLVGANDLFVKLPFIFEAFLYAFFATLLSLLLIGLGLHYISPMISQYLGDVSLDLQGFFWQNLWLIFLLELAVSSILSISCSLISIKKHLKI